MERCNVCGRERLVGEVFIERQYGYSGTPKAYCYCLKCYAPRDTRVIGLDGK